VRTGREESMLVAVIRLARREWRPILVIFLAVSSFAVAAAFLLPKRYEGAVLLNYVSDEPVGANLASLAGQFGGLAALAGFDMSSSVVQRNEALAAMASQQFSTRFIEKHNLMPVLFSDLWDARAGKWNVTGSDVPTLSDAFEVFDEDIRRITEDKSTGLITVAIRDRDPARVADLANDLVAEADSQLRQRALRDAQFTIAFLEKELSENNVLEVRQAVAQVLEAEINKATLANGRAEYAFRVVDPAVRPEADEFAWPNRPLIIAIGIVLGLGLGFAYVLLRDDIARDG
jgi:uncharacterized protein involved in exopolysaccharide biosynthesis